MLTLDRVGKTYPNGVRALDGISLEVAPGEILVVIGGSGCGKSTMLRAICGLDTPSQGKVVLDGTVITEPHEEIGIIFQEPRLLPWLRVADNVGFGLEHYPREERRTRVAGALDRVGLNEKARMWPRELSGGQAQRVAIARALVPRPQVLLLDEPFSALDAFTRADLQDHLLDLWADTKPTLVMVTHDVEEAIVLADRIMVMRPHPGRVYEEIPCDLPRPRDRQSAAFDFVKRRVLAALDRSLDRAIVTDDGETRPRRAAACGGKQLSIRRNLGVTRRAVVAISCGPNRSSQETPQWMLPRCVPCRRRSRSATRATPSPPTSRLKAKGTLDDAHIACKVETGRALAVAGLHPATGGSGLELCSGDMLLEALVACAGVTLKAVATAIDIPLKSGKVSAEGDLDFRGTLGVAKDAPVGFAQIRLRFDVETDAPQDKLDQLLKLTERYCVVYQTIKSGPPVEVTLNRA